MQIWFILWFIHDDGSKSVLDMIDWEPGYDGTARDQWRYVWGGWRGYLRDDRAHHAIEVRRSCHA